jgi:hypothetical protein
MYAKLQQIHAYGDEFILKSHKKKILIFFQFFNYPNNFFNFYFHKNLIQITHHITNIIFFKRLKSSIQPPIRLSIIYFQMKIILFIYNILIYIILTNINIKNKNKYNNIWPVAQKTSIRFILLIR